MPRAKQQLPTSLQRAYARRQKQVHSKSKHSISNLVPLHGRKEGLKSLSLQTLFIPKEGNGHGLAHEMSGLELGRGPDHLNLSRPLVTTGLRRPSAHGGGRADGHGQVGNFRNLLAAVTT